METTSILAPARIHRRLVAWVYDALIVTALWLVAGLISVALSGGDVAPQWLTLSMLAILIGSYFIVSWTRIGATAGMRAWRLRLVGLSNEPLTCQESATRLCYCLLCCAPFPLILLAGTLSSDRTTLYDRMSRTRVLEYIAVRGREKTSSASKT